jgi:predicted transcriptional regulator
LSLINDSKFKKAILSALADEDMLQIIKTATDNPISGNEIIKLCNIPHSTAYRKIKWMLESELLTITEMKFTDDGKKYALFQSTIHSINVNVERDGNMTITATKNIGTKQFFAKRFLSMDVE